MKENKIFKILLNISLILIVVEIIILIASGGVHIIGYILAYNIIISMILWLVIIAKEADKKLEEKEEQEKKLSILINKYNISVTPIKTYLTGTNEIEDYREQESSPYFCWIDHLNSIIKIIKIDDDFNDLLGKSYDINIKDIEWFYFDGEIKERMNISGGHSGVCGATGALIGNYIGRHSTIGGIAGAIIGNNLGSSKIKTDYIVDDQRRCLIKLNDNRFITMVPLVYDLLNYYFPENNKLNK